MRQVSRPVRRKEIGDVLRCSNAPISYPTKGVQEARKYERETCATCSQDLKEPPGAPQASNSRLQKRHCYQEKSSLALLVFQQKNTPSRTTHTGWLLSYQQ